MPHPQLPELRERLRELLAVPDRFLELAGLIVHEPESETTVQFRLAGKTRRRLVLHFGWPRDIEARRDVAGRIGLPEPAVTWRKMTNPFTGETMEVRFARASCNAGSVDKAAGLCLSLLAEIYGIPEDRWLFMGDVGDNPDEWPCPLPKPEPWPPAG